MISSSKGQLWLLILTIIVVVGRLLLKSVVPLLSVEVPAGDDALVVFADASDAALQKAADIYTENEYERIIVLGTPLRHGQNLLPFSSQGEIAAAVLQGAGIDSLRIIALTLSSPDPNYPLASYARELRAALPTLSAEIRTIDLYLESIRSRRSKRIFTQELGTQYSVGSLLYPPPYEIHKWWKSAEGLRQVGGELLALLQSYIQF